ncbi:hypothetical protein FHT77_006109 [Rhizobium sp. BK181]|nr:hypothetical protein [Rhizobium sp. BK181]
MDIVASLGRQEDCCAPELRGISPVTGRDAGKDASAAVRILAQSCRVVRDKIAWRNGIDCEFVLNRDFCGSSS